MSNLAPLLNCLLTGGAWRPREGMARAAGRIIGVSFAVVLSLSVLGGCTAAKMAIGSEGADVESVRFGMQRSEIDAVLGPPLFAKGSRETFYQATYAIAQKYQPGGGRVALGVLVDIMTLGTAAPFMPSSQPISERPRVVIVYDRSNRAIGMFAPDDTIPADGRSRKRPDALVPNTTKVQSTP